MLQYLAIIAMILSKINYDSNLRRKTEVNYFIKGSSLNVLLSDLSRLPLFLSYSFLIRFLGPLGNG